MRRSGSSKKSWPFSTSVTQMGVGTIKCCSQSLQLNIHSASRKLRLGGAEPVHIDSDERKVGVLAILAMMQRTVLKRANDTTHTAQLHKPMSQSSPSLPRQPATSSQFLMSSARIPLLSLASPFLSLLIASWISSSVIRVFLIGIFTIVFFLHQQPWYRDSKYFEASLQFHYFHKVCCRIRRRHLRSLFSM